MLDIGDIINIFLPAINHWLIWIIFLVVVIFIVLLYAYPYTKNNGKEFHYQHTGILITIIGSLYIFTKMLEGLLYSGSILKIDSAINNYMQALPSSWVTGLASFITNLGGEVMTAVFLILIVAYLCFKKRWHHALLSTVALLGASGLQFIIKALVQRSRPENLIETGFSFPSGHAITAITFVSLLIYLFKDDFKNLATRYVLIIVFSAFFLSVGISRIILHVHWFSDVIAGFSLGLAWFMFLLLVERAIPGVVPNKD